MAARPSRFRLELGVDLVVAWSRPGVLRQSSPTRTTLTETNSRENQGALFTYYHLVKINIKLVSSDVIDLLLCSC